MEALFLKLVNMSITASWLVLAVMAVRFFFKNTPKWIFCLLWGLVALRLICPFSIESAFSLIPSAQPLPQDMIYTATPQVQSGINIVDNTINPMLESSMTPMEPASANPTQIWSFILSQVWILGMVLMFFYTLISYLVLKRKVATAVPLGRGLKQSEFVDSPFVLGLFRPVIYLPFHLSERDMAYVLAHEKAHIRRRDHWWKPLGFLLLSIYWFNPVLWLAYVLLCRDIEAACDEKVIRDMDKEKRRAYSTALLNCSVHRRRIAACPLAFGEVGVKARVRGIMNYKKPAFWVLLIALIVSAAVAVCFLTNPESTSPDVMELVFFDRTMAHIEFHYDERFTDGEYQILDEFTLETWKDGSWQELTRPAVEKASNEVVQTSSKDADHDAWSVPMWEDVYGRLPEGTYRIRKDIVNQNSGETEPLYVEFTIGGTMEDYITYTLEDITPTGANLYEHEETGELTYNVDGFWMEVQKEGKWVYLEPTEDIHSVLSREKDYIHGRHYPSSHIELDWSGLYGQLPAGNYRIAREITHSGKSDLRLGTVYAAFTIESKVCTWFDSYASDAGQRHPADTILALEGVDGKACYDSASDEIRMITAEGMTPVISSPYSIRSAFLTDLTGDGVSEICATVQTEEAMIIQAYDPAEKRLYQYPEAEEGIHLLSNEADRLCVLTRGKNWDLNAYGQLAIVPDPASGALRLAVQEIDSVLEPLTKTVSCVDIANRKLVCISRPEEVSEIMALLRDLKYQITSASAEEFQQAREDTFHTVSVTITYQLGEKAICFSKDFRFVWENGAASGFEIANPEPIQSFVEAVTDGVRQEKVSGESFASVDTPWDWCKNVSIDALTSARGNVCLDVYNYGTTSGSTSTMGTISRNTVQELLSVLNRIPETAFIPGKTVSGENYSSLVNHHTANGGKIAMVDGVNNLAVVISHGDGKTELVMTDEMDKVRNDSPSYLQPMQVWQIQDQELEAFMVAFIEAPPVITYTVGAEYEWQEAIPFSSNGFSLELRLPEGWIWEAVTNGDNSGIRCRPESESSGWIYFSFWPEGYEPEETDRYISEGMYFGDPWYTSYPAEVSQPGSVDVTGAIWSYQRICTAAGDYAIINDGADGWFAAYQDMIEDTITLSQYVIES